MLPAELVSATCRLCTLDGTPIHVYDTLVNTLQDDICILDEEGNPDYKAHLSLRSQGMKLVLGLIGQAFIKPLPDEEMIDPDELKRTFAELERADIHNVLTLSVCSLTISCTHFGI